MNGELNSSSGAYFHLLLALYEISAFLVMQSHVQMIQSGPRIVTELSVQQSRITCFPDHASLASKLLLQQSQEHFVPN